MRSSIIYTSTKNRFTEALFTQPGDVRMKRGSALCLIVFLKELETFLKDLAL